MASIQWCRKVLTDCWPFLNCRQKHFIFLIEIVKYPQCVFPKIGKIHIHYVSAMTTKNFDNYTRASHFLTHLGPTHNEREWDQDRNRELEQHNRKQWILVPFIVPDHYEHFCTIYRDPLLLGPFPVSIPVLCSVNKPLLRIFYNVMPTENSTFLF